MNLLNLRYIRQTESLEISQRLCFFTALVIFSFFLQVLVETLLGICFLACRKEIIQVVIEAGLIPKMVSSLSHPIKNVAMAAIHAVGSIVVGTDDQTQSVLDCDALKYFPRLLSDQHPMIYMVLMHKLITFSTVVRGKLVNKQ